VTGRGKRILIIDDSRLARSKISRVLIDNGYDVSQAENGRDGINSIGDVHPDCVILDLLMPGMDGFQVLEELGEKGNTIPVIVLTADIQKTSRDRCVELGAMDFLNKPPDNDELLSVVARLTGGAM